MHRRYRQETVPHQHNRPNQQLNPVRPGHQLDRTSTGGFRKSIPSRICLPVTVIILLMVLSVLNTISFTLFFGNGDTEALLEQIERNTMVTGGCSDMSPLCERSGRCMVVDLADKRPGYRAYPRLIDAKIDATAIKDLSSSNSREREVIRGKHLRVRNIYSFLSGCGFFTFPLMVMNQLLVAQRLGLIGDKSPVIYMPEHHHYYNQCSNKENKGDRDFWEDWFLPLNVQVRWSDVEDDQVWEFSQDSIKTIYYDSNSIKAYPYGGREDSGSLEWISLQRARAQQVMREFNIQVRTELVEESRQTFRRLFGDVKDNSNDNSDQPPTIGVHMRGTDKFVTKKVELADYEDQVDRFLRRHPKGRIFVATDDPGYLSHMIRRYSSHDGGGHEVAYLNVTREKGNVLYNDTINLPAKSREVLQDMLLLSWTTTLVKTWSAVSEFSVYFRQARQNDEGAQLNYESVIDLQLFHSGKGQPSRSDNYYFDAHYKNPQGDEELEVTRAVYLPPQWNEGDGVITLATYENIMSELDRATSDTDCDGPRFQPRLCEWGFGSVMNSIVKPTMHALEMGYCLLEPVGWKKYPCEGWDTLFAPFQEPIMPVTVRQQALPSNKSKRRNKMMKGTHDDNEDEKGDDDCLNVFTTDFEFDIEGHPTFFASNEYSRCMLKYSFQRHGTSMLPDTHQDIGFFASVSLILYYLFGRPSEDMLKTIEQEKKDMKWPEPGTPVLGIHYRAGDSCLESKTILGRQCEPFDLYMEKAAIIKEMYGFSHIFLATDSVDVLETLDRYSGWTFHYRTDVSRGGKKNEKMLDTLLVNGELDGCLEAKDTYLDAYLLGQSDAFIGKFSSNLARVGYNLMYGRVRRHRPHISLDNIWCFDYGLKNRPYVETATFRKKTGSAFATVMKFHSWFTKREESTGYYC